MKAILLAGGFGTRLRPLTDTVPKCLVPIAGKPLLQRWLEKLDKAGVSDFLVNTHYLKDQVENFVANSDFNGRIELVNEESLLGTAGTLLANIGFFDHLDGILLHADNYCLADFAMFVDAHLRRPSECLLTVMAFRTSEPQNCGIFESDERNIAIGFHEKVAFPPGNLANGAVYILSKELLEQIPHHFPSAENFSTDILPHLVGKIFIYETEKLFLDIGTPENYEKANAYTADEL